MSDLTDFHLFVAIVEGGSFVEAANRLNMTPSGVSKKLSRFEQRLEVRLINRTTRSLALTEAGERLYQDCQHILAALAQAQDNVRGVTGRPRGRLRIASSDAFAEHVLVPFLGDFQRDYPDIHVSVVQGDGPLDMIAERIDVAIRFERPENAGFVVRRLCPDPWVICASPAYLQQHGTPESPQDLAHHRCLTIAARNQETRRWSFESDGTHSQMTVESVFSGIGLLVKSAACQGLGIARLANFLVRESINEQQLIPLLEDYHHDDQRSIYLVYPHREFVPQSLRVFIDALTQRFPDS